MTHIVRRILKVHLILSGLVLNAALIAILVLIGKYFYDLRLPFSVLVERSITRIEEKNAVLSSTITAGFNKLGILKPDNYLYGTVYHIDPDRMDWKGWGATGSILFSPQSYDSKGKPRISARTKNGKQTSGRYTSGIGETRFAGTLDQLLAAISAAQPGDRIVLSPGEYRITHNIEIKGRGTESRPITLAAEHLGDVRLIVESEQGFLVHSPYWVFENLEIHGNCTQQASCEHAYHIVGGAFGTVIRNNRLVDFNSMIKVNGETQSGRQVFPDFGLLESNSLYNHSVRDTDRPVTPIDIVGANEWVIRNNLIADFAKGRGDRISYAAFSKGNARGTVFESNIVVCQLRVPAKGSVRVGLSFGGGGTDTSACRGHGCTTEHSRGAIRNNIIMHCPSDVGIYLNRASEAEIYNNTLYNTVGIDVRFPESTALIFNNILSGRIHDRDGALSIRASNLVADFDPDLDNDVFHDWFQQPEAGNFNLLDGSKFVNQGEMKDSLKRDFCGNARSDGVIDIGAMEYTNRKVCSPLQDSSRS